jgi:hypothetical protein
MRQMAGVGVVLVSAGAMAAVSGVWPIAGLGLVALTGACVALRCSHQGPLGLWPAMVNEAGEHVPARWFCDQCGRSWPAGIERGRPPVQKFAGYDPSKAVQSAQRATELELRQRALAVRRAGIDRARDKSRPASLEPAAMIRPVPIADRRRAV